MSEKISCSVGILTYNSSHTLKQALESVKHFAEIIICDGGSTDETLPLARAYGAKILSQNPQYKDTDNRIIDFSGVRNQMLQGATYDWFFFLDSDELMTVTLQEEIVSLIQTNTIGAFWIPRKYFLHGEVIECAATYPTKQMRFFHKKAVTHFIKTIHERIEVRPDATIETLNNFMLVPIHSDPAYHRRKWNHYVALEVERRGDITLWGWFCSCIENTKISTLYLFRYIRNTLFCKGPRLPWKLEWERHVYHWHICKAFWRLIWKKSE
jgi:glycosyltransferase involved in cell wall biosynthesis